MKIGYEITKGREHQGEHGKLSEYITKYLIWNNIITLRFYRF